MIGVTQETRASSRVPFDIDRIYKEFQDKKRDYPFPEAVLRSVEVRTGVKKDDCKLLPDVILAPNAKPTVDQVTPESLIYTLTFSFEDKQGIQEYTYQLWEVMADDEKKANKEKGLNERIAHFWEAYRGANTAAADLAVAKIMEKGEKVTWPNYFKAVAKAFNTFNEGNPIFINVPVRIKLTRNTGAKNPNTIAMPMYGNVIERIVKEAKVSTLSVDGTDKFLLQETTKTFGSPANAGGKFGANTENDSSGWDDV